MSSDYAGPERRQQQRPRDDTTNSSIQHSIDELREYVDTQLGNFITKADLAATVAGLRVDVVRDVTQTIHAMVRDAVKSGIQEERYREKDEDRRAMVQIVHAELENAQTKRHQEFMAFMQQQREAERQERREDFKRFMHRLYGIAIGAAPLAAVINYVGNWLGWW